MDRNQIIGVSLLTVIVFVWFWMIPPQKPTPPSASAQDSTSQTSLKNATSSLVAGGGETLTGKDGGNLSAQDSFYHVQTNSLDLTFNHKGGALVHAVLNHFKQAHDTSRHVFFDYHTQWYQLTAMQKNNADFFFTLVSDSALDEGARRIVFQTSTHGNILQHIYTIYPQKNIVEWSIATSNFGAWFASPQIPFSYNATSYPSENVLKYELQMGNIGYNTVENNYDFVHLAAYIDHPLEEKIKWLSYKQRFFNTTFVAPNTELSNVHLKASTQVENYDQPFATMNAQFQLLSKGNHVDVALYIGENEYKKLNDLPYENMKSIIDYGSGMVAFVKYLNRGVILPFFLWITSFVSSMGWAIALLTIFIRLLTSPLLYSSYLSSAKMRALRPELLALKAKVGDDKQKYSMEQMSLYRQAGVNPLGGCIPALLQIPIFFALYSFFNSHIQLRSQAFLWATDLSTYDSIAHLPFSIPFYGDHVSLFNITATLTSFLISFFGMSMNQASPEMANNPAMKYMPYIFPFILLFVFNAMPAALTWYYTISNSITLIIQLVINKFIIDHDKIIQKIEANKKKKKGKSGFQQRMEEWQKMKAQK